MPIKSQQNDHTGTTSAVDGFDVDDDDEENEEDDNDVMNDVFPPNVDRANDFTGITACDRRHQKLTWTQTSQMSCGRPPGEDVV